VSYFNIAILNLEVYHFIPKIQLSLHFILK